MTGLGRWPAERSARPIKLSTLQPRLAFAPPPFLFPQPPISTNPTFRMVEAAPAVSASLSAEAPSDAYAAPATEAIADTEVTQAAASTESTDVNGGGSIPKKPKPVCAPYLTSVFRVTDWCSSVRIWAQPIAPSPYLIRTTNHKSLWMTISTEYSLQT